MTNITTLGELKESGYKAKSIKDEMRDNLIEKLKNNETVFEGVLGFDDTVIPDIERAILSRHNILLLGLRGQAKTRLARLMVGLLDEYIPVVSGSELNDDPLQPLTRYAKDLVNEKGDNTPISWIHRNERYIEKLATPDVSVADLIGDVDPIKAATMKLAYSDERVIHFGLIPRSHRCLFVINELPDLQARIQVSLFNMLQEGDIQIRGFKLRLPLDIQFLFTANPEDYTNRGSIITPLKDRIESQILTHYPREISVGKKITKQEARLAESQKKTVHVPEFLSTILERISFNARESEYIDEKSGVSARLTIAGFENLVSAAERRMLMNNDLTTTARITDFWGVVPAITGKVELVYEGEQEGPYMVAIRLLGQAIKEEFDTLFPDPEKLIRDHEVDPYQNIRQFFADGNLLELINDSDNSSYQKKLEKIPGLKELVTSSIKNIDKNEIHTYMEFVLFGLAEYNSLNRDIINKNFEFRDLLANMLDFDE